jgi:hypothetical protein
MTSLGFVNTIYIKNILRTILLNQILTNPLFFNADISIYLIFFVRFLIVWKGKGEKESTDLGKSICLAGS